MRHIKQISNYDCGATVYRMITNCKPLEAITECKTNKSGTHTYNVAKALKNKGISNKLIIYNLPYRCVYTELKLLSKQYSIYIGANFVSNAGKGRNYNRRHAFGIQNELIFDPAQEKELPMDCVGHLYNKDLIIDEIILVGIEE